VEYSLAVITLNEGGNISACLSSVPGGCEKVVVDSGSTDDTCAIAESMGARVVHRDFTTYAEQWTRAFEETTGEWVLALAGDEKLTPELREALIRLDPDRDSYRLRRRTWYMGRLLRLGPWTGETTLRLWRRGTVTVTDRSVHEEFLAEGATGIVRQGCIEHRSYSSLTDHLARMNRYCRLWADDMERAGRRSTLFHVTARPFWRFFSSYFLRCGFLEGVPGLVACSMSGIYVFLKWAMLLERQRRG
jgi:glycosyltransferase involved in cell wall biosynthesis